ncbi:MAG: hypothetical protein IPM16_10445 [Chloroflexi bacterium]|nr:hypothetical protein [Chloroflexota bacterium]
MSYAARIDIAPNKIIGSVHPHLYGANLEHIGRSVYGGVWAEMLRNRKFAGHDRMYRGLSEGLSHQYPGFGVVQPWEAVNPSYHDVLFVHDNTTFYTGEQAQRITIRRPDGQSHGIMQRGLWLDTGRAYTLRVVLKGENQPVAFRLDNSSHTLIAGPEWTTSVLNFTPQLANPDGALHITIETGSVWIGCASLTPADHIRGFRRDVIDAIKEWCPTFMRWPGGNFASAYHWQAGLGDRDRRSPYFDPAWNTWEPHDVGTDEFIQLCRLIGTEPILTINMGDGTADEAAAWVEYCNGDATTRWGAVRAAHGHPEPYGVKTWFVGNEQFGNWQVGHCDAETYALRFLEFAAAMRAVDPDLRLIGVGVPIDLYGHWNELVLQGASHAMDALSVHYYSIRTELWTEPPPADTLYWPKVASAHEMTLMLDRTIEIIAAHSAPPVPLAFDEWNTYVAGKAPDFFEEYDMADALYVGALMNACLQRADRIVMSAVFNLINVMGNYRVTPSQIWKTPSSLVLELFTHHRGSQSIRCDVTAPSTATPGAGNLPPFDAVPLMDAAATRDPVSGNIYVSIVNRDPEDELELTIAGVTRKAPSPITWVCGSSPQATNSEDDPRAVMLERGMWTASDATLRVPAHCVMMVEISSD